MNPLSNQRATCAPLSKATLPPLSAIAPAFAPNEPRSPVLTSGGKPMSGRGNGSENLKGRRVLVVEDEMLIALDIELTIESFGGVPLGPIQTVEEGLKFLQTNNGSSGIDVAILDISLHGEEVFPIATALEKRGVPFVFHTGHGSRTDLGAAWPQVPICQKPIDPELLLNVVGRLVRD